MLYHILARFEWFQFISSPSYYISCMTSVKNINSKISQPPEYQEMGFFPIGMISRKTFQELLHSGN